MTIPRYSHTATLLPDGKFWWRAAGSTGPTESLARSCLSPRREGPNDSNILEYVCLENEKDSAHFGQR